MKRKGLITWLAAIVIVLLAVPVGHALEERSDGSYLDRGFSTSPELTEETAIWGEFFYSEDRNTFYFVNDQPITSVQIEGLDGNEGVTYSVAGNIVTFSVDPEILNQTEKTVLITISWAEGTYQTQMTLRYNAQRLWWRYAYMQSGGYGVMGGYDSNWRGTPGFSNTVAFYFGPSGSETPLQVTHIESTAPGVASAEQVGTLADGTATVWRVSITGFGSGELHVYTDSGQMYSLPITVSLPADGFSTSEVLTEETYIRAGTFSHTGVGSVFYYVDREERSLGFTGATVLIDGEETDAVTCEVVDSGKAVKFTITGTLPARCQLTATFSREYGVQHQNSLYLVYAGEQLLYGYASGYGGEWTETEWKNPAPFTQSLGASSCLVFYFGTEDAAEGISGITEVTTSDPAVVTTEEAGMTQSGLPVYMVTGRGVGDASLTISAGDTVYELPVQVELPYGGFYSSPEAAEETYLSDGRFVYTTENDSVYYIFRYGEPGLTEADITAAILNYETGEEISVLGEYLECSVSNETGSTVIQFKVTKPLPAAEAYVRFSFDLGASGQQRESLRMADGSGRLLWLDCSWDGEQLTADLENGRATGNIGLTLLPGTSWYIGVFCFGTQEDKHILNDITEITADSEVVSVRKSEDTTKEGYPVWQIQPVDAGTATLSVKTGDGEQYTIPVTVSLPQRGFCTGPEMSAETFMRSEIFTCSGESDTFYYVTTALEEVFTDVELYTRNYIEEEIVEQAADFASAEILDGGRAIAITIDSGRMMMEQEVLYLRMSGKDAGYIGQQEFTVEKSILIVGAWQQITLPPDMQQLLGNSSAQFYLGTYDGAGRMTGLILFQTSDGSISRPALEAGHYTVFCLDSTGKPLTPACSVGPDLR